MTTQKQFASELFFRFYKLVKDRDIAVECCSIVLENMEAVEQGWEDDQGIEYSRNFYNQLREEIKNFP